MNVHQNGVKTLDIHRIGVLFYIHRYGVRMKMSKTILTQTNNICDDCTNFTAYYIKRGYRTMRKINFGRCGLAAKIKRHNGSQNACKNFAMRNPLEENKSQSGALRDLLIEIHKKLEDILEVMSAEEIYDI